jgi:hypothetical protein
MPLRTSIYIICPVQHRTPEQDADILDAVRFLEEERGHDCFLPGRDTPFAEKPENVWAICAWHMRAIRQADAVAVYYAQNTRWSLFDLAYAWAFDKPLIILNNDDVSKGIAAGDPYAILLAQQARAAERPEGLDNDV